MIKRSDNEKDGDNRSLAQRLWDALEKFHRDPHRDETEVMAVVYELMAAAAGRAIDSVEVVEPKGGGPPHIDFTNPDLIPPAIMDLTASTGEQDDGS